MYSELKGCHMLEPHSFSFIISGLEEVTLKLSCISFNVKHLCYILSNANNLTQFIHTVDAFIQIEAQ